MEAKLPDFPIVLYDGACAFCQRSIRFIHENDRSGSIRFLSLRHRLADLWLEELGVSPTSLPDSLIFIHQRKVFVRSEAVLKIGQVMGGWLLPLSYLGIVVPFRDSLYDLIARHRRKLKADCPMPTPAFRAKILG
jgi:predicted DCC family thiol-disulfide oxidoreductase YuxK